MFLSKKSKCSGCIGLKSGKEGFECKLGLSIGWKTLENVHTSPVPQERCHKPETTVELERAKQMLNK